MATLKLYSKPDCCLCDQGLPVVERLARRYRLAVEKVDVTSDPRLYELHGERIPVLELDGEELGWGRLSERALERKLDKRRGGGTA